MIGLKVGLLEPPFDVCSGTPIESGVSLFLFVGLRCFIIFPQEQLHSVHLLAHLSGGACVIWPKVGLIEWPLDG